MLESVFESVFSSVLESVAENAPASDGRASEAVSTRYEYASAGDHAPMETTGHAAEMHAPTAAAESTASMESTASTEATAAMATETTRQGWRCNDDCRSEQGRGDTTE
jgi:hypothetical protein